MSKILLINTRPSRQDTSLVLDKRLEGYYEALEARGAKLGDMRTEPNNGLLIIGHGLRKQGHEVAYLDLSALEYTRFTQKGRFFSQDEMFELAAERAADCDFIFFSTIIVGVDDCLKTADHIKKCFPDKIIVLGGTFPSIKPDYCLEQCNSIDVLVIGEGEILSGKIVNAYNTGHFEELHNASGLIFREGMGAPYTHRPGYNLIDLSEAGDSSIPDWSLLDPELAPHVYRIMTARGCGFRCSFCVPSHLNNHKVRRLDKKIILNALHLVKEHHEAANYVIGDLTFLYDENHSREILKSIINENIGLPFWCQTHLSRINEISLELLKKAGCSQLAVGIESIDSSVLKSINKGISDREIVKKLLMIKAFGIETQTYFIVGLPGDSLETIRLNQQFIEYGIQNNFIDRTHIGIYVPYPGPPSNKKVKVMNKDYISYTQGVFRDIPARPVCSNGDLSPNEIQTAYTDFLGNIGKTLRSVEKHSSLPSDHHTSKTIILGAEMIKVVHETEKHRKDNTVLSVFNVVQGIRKKGESFISSNIQRIKSVIIANAEIYSEADAEFIITQADGAFDVILLDSDLKNPWSGKVIRQAPRLIRSSTLLTYSDIQAWVRTVQDMILGYYRSDIIDQTIYIAPRNSYSKRLALMLRDFGADVILPPDESERFPENRLFKSKGRYDVLVSFGLNGTVLNRGMAMQIKEDGLMIDAAIGSIPAQILDQVRARNIPVFRPDMRTAIAYETLHQLELEEFMKKSIGTKNINGINFVSGGYIGKKSDVVVDSIHEPSNLIGLADGLGSIIPMSLINKEQIGLLVKAGNIIKK